MAGWARTLVTDAVDLEEPGVTAVEMRVQHEFIAEDVTFVGSVAGARVHTISFGDDVVWTHAKGVDVAIFNTDSLLRGMMKGQVLKPGLDIKVQGAIPEKGRFAVSFVGWKPK